MQRTFVKCTRSHLFRYQVTFIYRNLCYTWKQLHFASTQLGQLFLPVLVWKKVSLNPTCSNSSQIGQFTHRQLNSSLIPRTTFRKIGHKNTKQDKIQVNYLTFHALHLPTSVLTSLPCNIKSLHTEPFPLPDPSERIEKKVTTNFSHHINFPLALMGSNTLRMDAHHPAPALGAPNCCSGRSSWRNSAATWATAALSSSPTDSTISCRTEKNILQNKELWVKIPS